VKLCSTGLELERYVIGVNYRVKALKRLRELGIRLPDKEEYFTLHLVETTVDLYYNNYNKLLVVSAKLHALDTTLVEAVYIIARWLHPKNFSAVLLEFNSLGIYTPFGRYNPVCIKYRS